MQAASTASIDTMGDSTTSDQARLSASNQLFMGLGAASTTFDDPALLAASTWPLLSAATTSSLPFTVSSSSLPSSSTTSVTASKSSRMPTASTPSASTAATAAGLVLDGTAYGSSSYYNYPGYSAMYTANPTAAAAYYQQMTSGALRPSSAAAATLSYALGNTAQTAPYYGASAALLNSAAAATGANAYDYTAAYGANYYNGMRSGYYGLGSAYQSLSSGLDASSLTASSGGGAVREGGRKSKKKKKSAGSTSPPEAQYVRVFVWEAEDVSLLSHAQLEIAARMDPHSREPHLLRQAALQVHAFAFPASDQLDINEHDMANVEDAVVEETPPPSAADIPPSSNGGSASDAEGGGSATTAPPPLNSSRSAANDSMRRLAAKYGHLKSLYNEYGCNRTGLLEQCRPGGTKEFDNAFARVDALIGRRTDNVMRCLEVVTMRSCSSVDKYANVVLTNESIVSTAANLLLTGAAPFVPLENIYSCSKLTREAVLERLAGRFGKKCSFVLVSSNVETQSMARKEAMAVWPVSTPDTYVNLYTAQNDFLLGPRC